MTVSIVGIGAIGGTVAAHLIGIGKQGGMQLCSRRVLEHLTLIHPEGKIEATVSVLTEPVAVKKSDWVFLCTKAHQVEGAQYWLKRLCHSDTTIAVLQNGVEHEQRVQPYVGDAKILPVVVDCPAIQISPDKIQQKGPAVLTVPNNDIGLKFKSLFENTQITISLTDDIKTTAWKKLCLNVAGGAIATLTDQPLAALHQPGMADLAKALIQECIAVGRCEGALLKDSLADQIVNDMLEYSQHSLTSMLVDRRAGKPLEVDARNGAVVRIGKKHGVDTPLNSLVTTILSTINKTSANPQCKNN